MGNQRFVEFNSAVMLYKQHLYKNGCSESERDIIERILVSLNSVRKNGKIFIPLQPLKIMLENLSLAIEEKDPNLLQQQRGLKVERIVDIDEFVNSRDYANQKKSVRPAVMTALNEFWDSSNYYSEVLFSGGIGTGKTYFANMCLLYMLYVLSCYWNPQLEFGFAPGSGIFLIQQSRTETLAKRAVFKEFYEMVLNSKYFINHFNFDRKVKNEMRFPNNITVLPLGGSDLAALSLNVYGGILDELNFMARVKNSMHTRYTGEDEYDQAEKVYNHLRRRIKSRFMYKGKIPGKLILISSKNYEGDFTDTKKEEQQIQLKKSGKTDIYIVELAQWESIPADRFKGKKFLVEVGDDTRRSRIVRYKSEANIPENVIEIPIEYKADFERDMEGALKDIGGLSVGTRHPFIPYKELIVKAMEKHAAEFEGKSLFKFETIKLSVENPEIHEWGEWEEVINTNYVDDYLFNVEQPFTCHIDIGLNKEKGDAAGLAIGHIFGYTQLPEYKYYHPKRQEFVEVQEMNVPIYCIDGVLRIVAQQGDEIDLNLVRDLVLYVKQRVNIKWATMDTFQSRMMIQAFRRVKMRSGVLSVDTSIAPYTELKLSIKDERILLPRHAILHKEIREVEKITGKDRVDHPATGTKDVSDGVAGAIYILQYKEAKYYGERRSRRELGHNYQKVKVLGNKEDKRERMGTVI